MSEKSSYNILGFQFEPMKKSIIRSDKPGSDSDSSWAIESSDDEFGQILARCGKPAEHGVNVGNAKNIVTEDEWYVLPWTRVFSNIWNKGLETKFIQYAFLSFCDSILNCRKSIFVIDPLIYNSNFKLQ